MKDNYKKIETKIKNDYKLIAPILFLVILLISLFVFLYFNKYNRYHEEVTLKGYQYLTKEKDEFEIEISQNRKKEIIGYKIKGNENFPINSAPIYLTEENKIIFPKAMSAAYVTNNYVQYFIKEYAYIDYNDNKNVLTTEDFKENLEHYFLYSGQDLYFFLDKTTLIANGEEIELSPHSYVVAIPGNTLSYYDKESDTYKILPNDINAIIKSDYYEIKIMEDIVNYFGSDSVLVSNIKELYSISEKE